jgi:tetratricopeptide (TPR) repeat protein
VLKESIRELRAMDLEGQVLLREAQVDVLTFNLSSAERTLTSLIPTLKNSGDKATLAEAYFQYAKALQFRSKTSEALTSYQEVRELFEKTSDRQGLLRTYNNFGMLFTAQVDYAKARYYYELQQNLAREIGDETGLARSLVNLSLVSRHERKYPEALRLAEEALAIFQKENVKLGIASAHQNLSVINHSAGIRPAAIHHGQTALLMFQDLQDLRGLGAMLGLLGDFYRSTGDPMAGGYYLSYIALQRYLTQSPTPGIQRDIDIRTHDLSALRGELGREKYASLVTEWLRLVEKTLIPQGITDPVIYLPKELLEGHRE